MDDTGIDDGTMSFGQRAAVIVALTATAWTVIFVSLGLWLGL